MPHDQSQYPRAIDWFREVSDGNNPENRVTADLVNKVQNATLALENHCQYSVTCPNPTGCAVLCRYFSYTLIANLPSQRLIIPVSVGLSPLQVAALVPIVNGQRNPFGRGICIFAFADAYHVVAGVRNFYQVRCGVNVVQENVNQVLTVDIIKDAQWLGGDVVDVTIMLARP